MLQYRQLQKTSHSKASYQHNTSANPDNILKTQETTTPYRESFKTPHLSPSITSKLKNCKSKLTELACKMPSGLLILHVPSNLEESAQFVRLARKGFGRKVIFLHPNGEFYKVPQYTNLKGHERDCGPQTAPVFVSTPMTIRILPWTNLWGLQGAAKRTCEGGCCGELSIDPFHPYKSKLSPDIC